MALQCGTRLGPYEIVSAIGSGGMGEVYRARDTRLGRFVAIKVLSHGLESGPQAFERFQREARAASALNHPNICTIHDVGSGDPPFIAMELLAGETLQQRLTRGPLELRAVVAVAVAIADALTAAHAVGIVHRDIKPANVFLTSHGPKVLDFGLAKAIEGAVTTLASAQPTQSAYTPLTDAGVTVGTVAYMSPEQLRGEELDARTDLFSLGLVLYEMAIGKPAFRGSTNAVTSAAILYETPPRPHALRPEIPSKLEDVIFRALEKDRDVRFQTAADLCAEHLRGFRARLRAVESPTSRRECQTVDRPSRHASRLVSRWAADGIHPNSRRRVRAEGR
jgi:eukaryotic-like serine/threonine-protein kinase